MEPSTLQTVIILPLISLIEIKDNQSTNPNIT
jgi:hypothetical protein